MGDLAQGLDPPLKNVQNSSKISVNPSTDTLFRQHMEQMLQKIYLRNRKHVPCFYRVVQTRVEVWETRNAVGTRAAGECFHSFFEFSQTFTSVCITR